MTGWLKRLVNFSDPSNFLAIVRESESVPDDRFFNDPALKSLREAWAAGYFTLGLKRVFPSVEVRLNKDRFPDFHIRIGGSEYEFEFTLADKPERLIGKGYKDRRSDPLQLKSYQPERGRREGPSWVAGAVRKKFYKHYSICPHLLVYANFEASALDPLAIADSCRQWLTSFSSIWILWNYKYLQLYDSDVFRKTDYIWRSIGVNPWA